MRNLNWIFLIFAFLSIDCNKNTDNTIPFYLGVGTYDGNYFPTTDWRECTPEEVGMSSSKLGDVYAYANQNGLNTDGYIVIKDGYIVSEAYFGDFKQNDFHTSYSVAKSFTSALIGIAIDQGYLQSVDEKIFNHFPLLQQQDTQAEKQDVTVKHLLTMTAGFEWNETDYYGGGTNDIYLMYSTGVNDFVEYVLNKPIIRTPGSETVYSSGESVLLGGLIHNTTGQSMFNYGETNLFTPLGIQNITWESDPNNQTIGGWGINTTLRNFAKFGYLYLNNGNWDGNQIVPLSWVEDSVDPQVSGIDNYGYQWWIGGAFSSFQDRNLPSDIYLGIGIYQQYIIIIPSENIVIVRMGNDIPSQTPQWEVAEFVKLVLDAIET